MDGIDRLQKWIDESNKIVFFGGAGVSTESGIPDFRSVDGLYHQHYSEPPETILSHSYYVRKKEEFYRFYRDKMLCLDAKPNEAHIKLAELENEGKLAAVVTQNIDGLHQMAGSKTVYELHGSVHRNYCQRCRKMYNAEYVLDTEGIPKCDCGGELKPDVVLYEEGLDDNTVTKSIEAIKEADMLIVGGTSLVVYPAAGLINYYSGNKMVLINLASTPKNAAADLVINGKIGEVFSKLHV